MCGIAGEMRFDGKPSSLSTMKAMCDAQIHRGPDDDGYYASGHVSLGIRRLAIIDLTKGLYPLRNENESIHLVFNGEIYGFDSLRTELEEKGHMFRSNTDAETVVHSYEEWGTECLERLNGMFAFALWDQNKGVLWIARDHFGIKPLYYFLDKDFLAFASEIKPLLVHTGVTRRPNDRVISVYIASGRVDDTAETFFDGIMRLPPAHHLLVKPSGSVNIVKYWSPNISQELDGDTSNEEVEETRRLFLEAVKRQLVSDVPVGTCLSGGIDSSSVVSAIRRVHPRGYASTGEWIRTFSAVFPGYSIDESKYAVKTCQAAQAEYNPVEPAADELWQDLLDLVRCQEEPFSSTSIYAQYRVMRLARQKGVTVLLDGQGGDELLCGYIPLYLHYLLMLSRHKRYHRLFVEGIRSHDLISPLVRPRLFAYLKRMARHVIHPVLRHGQRTPGSPNLHGVAEDDLPGILEVLTTKNGLPALLRYEDKNSMWHSIEARVPFLDRPFFEYEASLPLDRKLRDGWTKEIFRRAMTGILPEEIRVRRSKIGFETPERIWIDRELRARVREFFSGPDLAATKFYSLATVHTLLGKPKMGAEEARFVWRTLNLELWWREFFGATRIA